MAPDIQDFTMTYQWQMVLPSLSSLLRTSLSPPNGEIIGGNEQNHMENLRHVLFRILSSASNVSRVARFSHRSAEIELTNAAYDAEIHPIVRERWGATSDRHRMRLRKPKGLDIDQEG